MKRERGSAVVIITVTHSRNQSAPEFRKKQTRLTKFVGYTIYFVLNERVYLIPVSRSSGLTPRIYHKLGPCLPATSHILFQVSSF